MTTRIQITNRIGWKNGDYIEEVSDGKEVMIYRTPKMAKNSFEAMNNQGAVGSITYDGNITVTRILKGFTEKEIVNKIKEDITNVAKHKIILQKIKYKIL